MTAAKFKPLIFSVPGFALFSVAHILILIFMIWDDQAQFKIYLVQNAFWP
jgi:hypothetical protein